MTGRPGTTIAYYLWEPCPGDVIDVLSPGASDAPYSRLRLLRVGKERGVLVFEDQPLRRDGTFNSLPSTRIVSEDEARDRVAKGRWQLKYKGVPEEARPFSYGRLVEG